MIERIVAATGNENKVRELQAVAERFGITLLSPRQAERELRLGPPPAVDEVGDTYRENALLKAEAYRKWAGIAALGDDSGLEVTALGGKPGVHSARWAGEGKNDAERIQKVLTELEVIEKQGVIVDRSACFRCFLILARADGEILEEDFTLSGTVLRAPHGSRGYGYDPIIYLPSLGATLAEVDFSVTSTQGFRALAAEKLFSKLIES